MSRIAAKATTIKARSNPARRPQLADPDATVLIPNADYMQAVRQVLGLIELDPCSSPKAQVAIEAQGWYRADQASAALAEPWAGRTFLHPHPEGTTGRLQVQKLIRDYLSDRVPAAIILSQRPDLLRSEPLLLSFPWLLHYNRLSHWQWNPIEQKLVRHSPSFNSVTHYLPPKDGSYFSDAALEKFAACFERWGRVVMADDLGAGDWQQQALIATRRMPIPPVLTTTRVNRHDG
jgi:hypothetical protein